MKKWLIIFGVFILLIIVSLAVMFSKSKPSEESFKAPGKDFQSAKKVENYFIDTMHMTSADAVNVRSLAKGYDGKISFRLTDKSTLDAIVGNLYYYGFIRDEKAFMYALEHTKDTVVGKANALKVGKSGTIDVGAYYRISEDMDAWQLADVLLNKPTYLAYDEYGYIFMP